MYVIVLHALEFMFNNYGLNTEFYDQKMINDFSCHGLFNGAFDIETI